MKTSFITILMLMILRVYVNGQVISDPVNYYLQTYSHQPNDKILKVQVDFSRDGKKVVLLAYSSNVDRSGYLWMAFAPVKGGYSRTPVNEVNGKNEKGAVTFRTDAVHQGAIAELKSYGLLCYSPSGDTGELTGITMKDGALTQALIKEIHPQGADSALYNSLFQARNQNRLYRM